ncbi:MAG: hypothetical protein BMS9Abin12_2386 [Acidimicrobiia bacterium]|nr:MAG: hypothetical protein BMS9Abin12_2386 [Acidimicrobiia bacterium]
MLAGFTLVTLFSASPTFATSDGVSGTVVVSRIQADGSTRWETIARSQLSVASELSPQGRGRIVAISENAEFVEFAIPNDPLFSEQWNFSQIGATAAWDQATGAGVVVAILDSGVDPGPDLACRTFVSPYNAFTGLGSMGDVLDGTGHGTHITGTVAQCTNNGTGVAGLAYGATIMPVKVLDDTGSGDAASVANGIAYAVSQGADVINLSLGFACNGQTWPTCSVSAIDTEIAAAVAAGVTIVAASGNDGSAETSYPAGHPLVVAVGATDSSGGQASYSNGGTSLDVVAPGGDTVDRDSSGNPDLIWQESLDEFGVPDIIGMFGTSMSSAHVTATVALMLERNPTWTPLRTRCVLIETASDIGASGFDSATGWGEIDPTRAATHTGEAFSDITSGWFVPAVDFVAQQSIAQGYDDCTFGPNDEVSRAEMVTLLSRATGLDPVSSPAGIFTDVPKTSVFAPYIEAAAGAGWVTGYPDGSFDPGASITRAEVAALSSRLWGPGAGGQSSPFTDVVPGAWYHGDVVDSWDIGAVNGYGDGTYRPDGNMTRAEAAQIIFNMLAVV